MGSEHCFCINHHHIIVLSESRSFHLKQEQEESPTSSATTEQNKHKQSSSHLLWAHIQNTNTKIYHTYQHHCTLWFLWSVMLQQEGQLMVWTHILKIYCRSTMWFIHRAGQQQTDNMTFTEQTKPRNMNNNIPVYNMIYSPRLSLHCHHSDYVVFGSLIYNQSINQSIKWLMNHKKYYIYKCTMKYTKQIQKSHFLH